ncbi:MAG: methyltransferase domain-containing protein [Candidatus Omnitrophica bacterium]|nr:methyltransferase domain-containing protein [Candidatus Omnitrophota bacterium]
MSINITWPQYFGNYHEGVGTTYERFILHKYFEFIRKKCDVQSVLESPSFGMTGISGINSMWWAWKGVEVTITDSKHDRISLIKEVWQKLGLKLNIKYYPDITDSIFPFKDKSFDLGWNFAALWFVSDLEKFLKELARVCKKAVFICIPNKSNIFCKLRVSSSNLEEIPYPDNIDAKKIIHILGVQGWDVKERGYFDVPPWPDIAMKKEELLAKIGFKKNKDINSEKDYICILDFFNGKKIAMEKEIMKYSFLENSPILVRKLWAHHQYFIFEPKDGLK